MNWFYNVKDQIFYVKDHIFKHIIYIHIVYNYFIYMYVYIFIYIYIYMILFYIIKYINNIYKLYITTLAWTSGEKKKLLNLWIHDIEENITTQEHYWALNVWLA